MPTDPAPVRRSIATYTAWRIGLAAGVFAVCVVAGLDTPISLVIAFLVSSIASFVLLRTQRDELTEGLVARRAAKLEARDKRRTALDEG